MTAATKDRDTQEVAGRVRAGPMAAATKVWGGTMACINNANLVVKGATSATLTCVGVFKQGYDNTGGAAGAVTAEYHVGTFQFANSASTDQVNKKDAGKDCYIVDDSTVALTDGTATRSKAGKVYDVDANGVWVTFA